jgi:ribosomal-protein-alanine N-acetyltransferase
MTADFEDARIRPMTAADVERVMEIARGLKDAPQWAAAAYRAAMDREGTPRRFALVAEKAESGVPGGFLVASLVPPEAELETIAVVAECQRRGVARRLWAAMAEQLRAAGVTEVNLEVRASNGGALGFYRAEGFVEAGRRPRYYADPEEDAILLGKRLA